MTVALEGGEWSAARPVDTTPGRNRYPFYRRLGGPQGRSGRTENLVPTGIRSRTVQPVNSRYTDWATRPAPIVVVVFIVTHRCEQRLYFYKKWYLCLFSWSLPLKIPITLNALNCPCIVSLFIKSTKMYLEVMCTPLFYFAFPYSWHVFGSHWANVRETNMRDHIYVNVPYFGEHYICVCLYIR